MADELKQSQLARIVVPAITDVNYAEGMADAFDKINDNFKKIASLPFLQGVQGDSYQLEEYSIWEEDNTGNWILTEDGQVLLNSIFGRDVTKDKDGNDTTNSFDIIRSNIDEELDGVSPIDFFKRGNDIVNNSLYFYVIKDDTGNVIEKQLGQFYYFIDERLKKIGDSYNSENVSSVLDEFNDYTGFYQYRYNPKSYNQTYLRLEILPSVYYDQNKNDICWKFNGNETGISAIGVEGTPGKDADFSIVLVNAGPSDNSAIVVAEFNYLGSNAAEMWDNTNLSNMPDGKAIICCRSTNSNNEESFNFAYGELIRGEDNILNAYWNPGTLFSHVINDMKITSYFYDMGDNTVASAPHYLAIPSDSNRINGTSKSSAHVIKNSSGDLEFINTTDAFKSSEEQNENPTPVSSNKDVILNNYNLKIKGDKITLESSGKTSTFGHTTEITDNLTVGKTGATTPKYVTKLYGQVDMYEGYLFINPDKSPYTSNAGNSLIITKGNLQLRNGDIDVTGGIGATGNITAGGRISATGNIETTTGSITSANNITATNGNLTVGGTSHIGSNLKNKNFTDPLLRIGGDYSDSKGKGTPRIDITTTQDNFSNPTKAYGKIEFYGSNNLGGNPKAPKYFSINTECNNSSINKGIIMLGNNSINNNIIEIGAGANATSYSNSTSAIQIQSDSTDQIVRIKPNLIVEGQASIGGNLNVNNGIIDVDNGLIVKSGGALINGGLNVNTGGATISGGVTNINEGLKAIYGDSKGIGLYSGDGNTSNNNILKIDQYSVNIIGGVQKLCVGEKTDFASDTNHATYDTKGSLQAIGDAYIGKKLYVGGVSTFNNDVKIINNHTTTTNGNLVITGVAPDGSGGVPSSISQDTSDDFNTLLNNGNYGQLLIGSEKVSTNGSNRMFLNRASIQSYSYNGTKYSATDLHLNPCGGGVNISKSGSTTTIKGNATINEDTTAKGNIEIGVVGKQIILPTKGVSWKDTNNLDNSSIHIKGPTSTSTSFHSLIGTNSKSNNIVNIGVVNDAFGIYGIINGSTPTSGPDWKCIVDTNTGDVTIDSDLTANNISANNVSATSISIDTEFSDSIVTNTITTSSIDVDKINGNIVDCKDITSDKITSDDIIFNESIRSEGKNIVIKDVKHDLIKNAIDDIWVSRKVNNDSSAPLSKSGSGYSGMSETRIIRNWVSKSTSVDIYCPAVTYTCGVDVKNNNTAYKIEGIDLTLKIKIYLYNETKESIAHTLYEQSKKIENNSDVNAGKKVRYSWTYSSTSVSQSSLSVNKGDKYSLMIDCLAVGNWEVDNKGTKTPSFSNESYSFNSSNNNFKLTQNYTSESYGFETYVCRNAVITGYKPTQCSGIFTESDGTVKLFATKEDSGLKCKSIAVKDILDKIGSSWNSL